MFSEDMSEEDLSEDMYNIWKEDFDKMAKKKKSFGFTKTIFR